LTDVAVEVSERPVRCSARRTSTSPTTPSTAATSAARSNTRRELSRFTGATTGARTTWWRKREKKLPCSRRPVLH